MGMRDAPCVSRLLEIWSSSKGLDIQLLCWENGTCTLFPCPVHRHEVMVLSLTVLKLVVWNVVHVIHQVSISEEAMDEFAGVMIPELVIIGHPLGDGTILWTETIVVYGV